MNRASGLVILLGLFGAWGPACSFQEDCGCGADGVAETWQEDAEVLEEDSLPQGDLAGPCPVERRLGGFSTTIGPEFSFVEGKVASGVLPSSVPDLAASEGDCRLLRRPSLVCQPPCNSQQTCDRGNKCIPFPGNVDLGVVTVKGLAVPVAMGPLPPGTTYSATQVPRELFEPGDHVLLEVSQGPFGPFSLDGDGVAALAGLSEAVVLKEGEVLGLAWTAAGSPRTRVDLKLTIDQHGSSPLALECSFPDTGTAQVPGALLDQLIQSGVTGYPNGSLTRRSADRVDFPEGCVDFLVYDGQNLTVRVAGFTPCKTQEDCPQGLTCNTVLERCE